MSDSLLPEGFEEIPGGGPFAEAVGPFYCREVLPGVFEYGFIAERRHENPNGVLHGGMLYSFADHIGGHRIVHGLGRVCATVSLTAEYLAGATSGNWISASVEVVRATGSMAFLRILLSLEGQPVMQANGVWRLFAEIPAQD